MTAKPITAKETINWDLSTLSKDKFTLSSTLNKPHFEQLDRILRSNDLYNMATNVRVRPRHTATNESGRLPRVYHEDGISFTEANDVEKYAHDLNRLTMCMHAAVDKALHHQSQGFIDKDPIMMYTDLRKYFYGRDNNGIRAARLALDAGSYHSSVINGFSYGFCFKCICKLDPASDLRAYLMLTIIYDFMAFISLSYRFRLNYKPASVNRLSAYRDELLRCIADYSNHINIDNEIAVEFEAL